MERDKLGVTIPDKIKMVMVKTVTTVDDDSNED